MTAPARPTTPPVTRRLLRGEVTVRLGCGPAVPLPHRAQLCATAAEAVGWLHRTLTPPLPALLHPTARAAARRWARTGRGRDLARLADGLPVSVTAGPVTCTVTPVTVLTTLRTCHA